MGNRLCRGLRRRAHPVVRRNRHGECRRLAVRTRTSSACAPKARRSVAASIVTFPLSIAAAMAIGTWWILRSRVHRATARPNSGARKIAATAYASTLATLPRLVQAGEHTYELVFRTDRQLGYFADHDELYWNVTGNGWDFPIDRVTARVELPQAIPRSRDQTRGDTPGRRARRGRTTRPRCRPADRCSRPRADFGPMKA